MAVPLPAPPSLRRIPGLEDQWARMTRRASHPSPDEMADRIRLDVLGLGINQSYAHLGQGRPDFDGFESWVRVTAGEPDPVRIERFAAWAAGEPPPAAAAAEIAAVDAMAPALDPGDLARWDRDGVVVLRGAISREEAAAAEALLWRSVGASPDDPSSWSRPRAGGIWVECFQDPALEPARRSRRIHKAFAQLHGTADLWSNTDRMSFNPPETAALPFQGAPVHWDMSLAAPRPLLTGGILYLTDTAADQGALRVVPGFHRRLDAWLAGLAGADPRAVDLSGEAVPVPAGAGDLVIWRHELPHGASPNRAARPRMAQYVDFYSPAQRHNPIWI